MAHQASPTDQEAKELNLVGKVEFRIALADSDAKIEALFKTYLCPLLLKLASEHLGVRNKVISICQHVNARIKPPEIQLPVSDLLKQFKDQQNTLIRHFDLLYAQQGIDRLKLSERAHLLPSIFHGIHADFIASRSHTSSLFNLFLKTLHSLKIPERGNDEDLNLRSKFGLQDRNKDAEFVALWLGKLLLFSHNPNTNDRSLSPGLSSDEITFLKLEAKKDAWQPSATGGLSLVETKILGVKFLASGAFVDSERFTPALIASADSNTRISDVGNDILKRATGSVSFEDPEILKALLELYLGRDGSESSLPVRVPLQTKILGLLCRSKLISTYTHDCQRIVIRGLGSPPATSDARATGAPTEGLEATKLRGQVFAFTNWLARISSQVEKKTLIPGLIQLLRDFIVRQGWPRLPTDSPKLNAGTSALRGYSYESIGLLAQSLPDEVTKGNLDLLKWFLDSLSKDNSQREVIQSIEQAMGSILSAFGRDLNDGQENELTELLTRHMQRRIGDTDESGMEVLRSTRYLVVRLANRALSFSNIPARWMNMLAMNGDSNEQSGLVDEGKKGIDPYYYKTLNPFDTLEPGATNATAIETKKYKLPAFNGLVQRLFGADSYWENVKKDQGADQLKNTFSHAITFCRCVLFHECLQSIQVTPVIDTDWSRKLDALVLQDADVREKLRDRFSNLVGGDASFSKALDVYLNTLFYGMSELSGEPAGRSGECLLETCSLGPQRALEGLTAKLRILQTPILSSQKVLRETSSHLFGLLASQSNSSPGETHVMMKVFRDNSMQWNSATGSKVLAVHGSILATTFFLSRTMKSGPKQADWDEYLHSMTTIAMNILEQSRDQLLLNAVCVYFGELTAFGVILPESLPSPRDAKFLLEKLSENAKKGNETAIYAVGNLGTRCSQREPTATTRETGDTETSTMIPTDSQSIHEISRLNLEHVVETLYDLHQMRQPEVQFAVGAALSSSVLGWQSKALMVTLDVGWQPAMLPDQARRLSSVLDHVLKDSRSTKPSLRQASVIWLLCLVQYCGHVNELRSRLRECQAAFQNHLADRDSLNQESASRGLSLVYEKGDQSLRDSLVSDLVRSFTSTSANLAGNVSEDTALFDPGALPTGDGSVSTYKDILSLASEAGDPTLVYKFMSLASNNAIWSSRAAFGRFGLSNIISDSGYLESNPRLLSALFRYRHDPNANVRSSMNEIWATVVKDTASTVNAHFETILKDLLKNILGKEWRVRSACCAAIADLIQGRPVEKYERYLAEIWTSTFKVIDDIKDSVSSAAMSLAKVLLDLLTHALEAGDSSSRKAQVVLNEVMPILLSPSGMESGAKTVQLFALQALIQIIKSGAGKALRPFLPDLVSYLLSLLSSLEPQEINFLHLNADKYDLTLDQIDGARLRGVRDSPLMEAIERCLDALDKATMDELARKLKASLKELVGLPSKTGFTRVLVSLSTKHHFVFQPHADSFLKLSQKQVFDRNETISLAFANACGFLARLSSDRTILNTMDFCRQTYFETDEERQRVVVGEIVHATSKHAADRFHALASDILPFVFVAKHDIAEQVNSRFRDTWNETVGGPRAVLLYIEEITSLILRSLESPRWSVKHTAAYAIADVVDSGGAQIGDAETVAIWPALEKALGGKSWEGKEKVLQAFTKFSKNSSIASQDNDLSNKMQKIIIRESKRANPAYRQHALACLGTFVESNDAIDLYNEVHAITSPLIDEVLGDSDGMDIDGPLGVSSKSMAETTLSNAIGALLKSVNPKNVTISDLPDHLSQTLSLINKTATKAPSRLLDNSILDAEKVMFARLHGHLGESISVDVENVLLGYLGTIFRGTEWVEPVRLKAAETAKEMANVALKGGRIRVALADNLATARAQERSYSVQQSLDRARQTLDSHHAPPP